MRPNATKKLLKEGKPAFGTWLSLGNITAARLLARTGFNWLTIDTEHSLVNIETTTHMLASIADAGCTALARVPANRHDHIKRVLDNGAHGVVVPMVNTREEAMDAVAACRYPPVGNRSVGGAMHALNFDTDPVDYYAHANEEILVIIQCEHIQAVRDADKIFSVPGVDAVFVGPNDLSASMRDKDGNPPKPEVFQEAIMEVLRACKRNRVPSGIHAFTAAEAELRISEGWQFIAISSELKMMMDGAKALLSGLPTGRSTGDLARY